MKVSVKRLHDLSRSAARGGPRGHHPPLSVHARLRALPGDDIMALNGGDRHHRTQERTVACIVEKARLLLGLSHRPILMYNRDTYQLRQNRREEDGETIPRH